MSKNKLKKQKKQKKQAKKEEATKFMQTTGYGSSSFFYSKCKHPAVEAIKVGNYELYLGACRDIEADTLEKMDYIFPLNDVMPDGWFGQYLPIICAPMTDRGGVPKNWETIIKWCAKQIENGKNILGYCTGGHGRTGTFGASIISLMEPWTPDPIDAIRERHCMEAVESQEQAIAIFALRGKELPKRYRHEFKPFTTTSTSMVPSSYASSVGSFTSHTTACTLVTNPHAKACFNSRCKIHRYVCDLEQGFTKCLSSRCKLHKPVHDVIKYYFQDAFDEKIIDLWGSTFNNGDTQYWCERTPHRINGIAASVDAVIDVLAQFRVEQQSSTNNTQENTHNV